MLRFVAPFYIYKDIAKATQKRVVYNPVLRLRGLKTKQIPMAAFFLVVFKFYSTF